MTCLSVSVVCVSVSVSLSLSLSQSLNALERESERASERASERERDGKHVNVVVAGGSRQMYHIIKSKLFQSICFLPLLPLHR